MQTFINSILYFFEVLLMIEVLRFIGCLFMANSKIGKIIFLTRNFKFEFFKTFKIVWRCNKKIIKQSNKLIKRISSKHKEEISNTKIQRKVANGNNSNVINYTKNSKLKYKWNK